jgi:uncharacterized coiled-coil DUF342 family protein
MKTRVDDMLIEMISPKVKEIEEKFSNGGRLSQDDINTLLLKSQYNHINHLDIKLDETVESVKDLEVKFDKLELRFNHLEDKLTNDMKNLETRLVSDMKSLENKLTNDMKNLENKFHTLEEKIEATIQKALNKNMMLLIVVIGLFMTISKIIDKF